MKFNKKMAPYFIAEIGQNHNGNLDVAKKYIALFAQAGASAMKFQTRDNKYLFSEEAYNSEYQSENAFGKTYGEHREFLELSRPELEELKLDCQKFDVDFISTPFDEPSVDLLMDIGVDAFKVASFDLGNLPFIQKLVATQKPIILSVGGGQLEHIKDTVDFLMESKSDFTVLHCVSKYPTPVSELRLGQISELIRMYPDITVGSSDHFNGILSGPVAYMLGAKVFEKHVTLDRSQKGTDHSFALEFKGFKDFVRDITRIDDMIANTPSEDLGSEPVFQKLGKSIVAAKALKAGEIITLESLSGRIFSENSIPVRESKKLIGRTLLNDVEAGEKIYWDYLSNV